MKKILFFLFTFFSSNVNAQKHDFIWIAGYDGNSQITNLGLSSMDFNNNQLIVKKIENTFMDMDFTCAAIADKTGKLALYSNGNILANSSNDTVKNGGQLFSKFSDVLTINQGTIIIPFPEKDSLYLVLSQAYGAIPVKPYTNIKYFKYHIIDMAKNNGKGEVTLLEANFCNYIPAWGKLTVCKHSNGKDLWLLVQEHGTNKFYRYLITKNGVGSIGTQNIGINDPFGVGTAAYSPDGAKFAIYNNIGPTLGQVLEIFDFDRCTGLLSNPTIIKYTNKGGAGVVFSSTSQFLYVGLSDEIRQYNMNATDIAKSGKTVATSDNFPTCLGGNTADFYNGQLAPNGKIYFNCYGCSNFIHVIENPNIEGTACNVKQHAITLPTFYYGSLCNFPNFRLGKAAQPCEMVGNEEVEKVKYEVKLYPNPAQDFITIDKGNSEVNILLIYALDGKLLSKEQLSGSITSINTSYLKSGMYYCRLLGNEHKTPLKFTIIR